MSLGRFLRVVLSPLTAGLIVLAILAVAYAIVHDFLMNPRESLLAIIIAALMFFGIALIGKTALWMLSLIRPDIKEAWDEAWDDIFS